MAERTRVKICGMTDAREVQAAVAAGVDALGFIFAPRSPRRIAPEAARAIIRELPPFVMAVGVFVNEELAVVEELAHFCGLHIVQLHGSESPDYCRALNPRTLMKAISVRPATGPEELTPYAGLVSAFLLDTYHEKLAGGSGESFDWRLVAQLAAEKPLVLAGGLTPENVGAAIRQVRPFAVDVNSGVELAPGRKDPEKIARLLAEVALADRELASSSN